MGCVSGGQWGLCAGPELAKRLQLGATKDLARGPWGRLSHVSRQQHQTDSRPVGTPGNGVQSRDCHPSTIVSAGNELVVSFLLTCMVSFA